MAHWFWRWLTLTWAVHLVAQIGFIFTIAGIFAYLDDLNTFIAGNRPIIAFFLVVHFVAYLLAALLSTDRERLDKAIDQERDEAT